MFIYSLDKKTQEYIERNEAKEEHLRKVDDARQMGSFLMGMVTGNVPNKVNADINFITQQTQAVFKRRENQEAVYLGLDSPNPNADRNWENFAGDERMLAENSRNADSSMIDILNGTALDKKEKELEDKEQELSSLQNMQMGHKGTGTQDPSQKKI